MRELKDFIKDKKIDLKRLKKFGFKLNNDIKGFASIYNAVTIYNIF